MTLALTFVEPLLLVGALAAGIPIVLHLLSSVRAQDMMFPTLRFLKMSMEKTARRRRLQHWLLLLLRAAMFALLALALSEPLSRATGGWLSGKNYSAVLILDNGYSMAVNSAQGSRFERAKSEAASLLSGDEKPGLAAVMTTNGGFLSRDLSGGLEDLRAGLSRARIGYGPVPLAQRFESACRLLEDDTAPRRAIYIFSDLQRTSFESIAALEDLGASRNLHVLVVDTARGQVNNVGITDLQVTGQRVVDSVLEFSTTLANASPTDKTVDVAFQVDGAPDARRVRKSLRPAGQEGSTATVRFHHRFVQAGDVSGKVFLSTSDDLPVDNLRRFSLTIGGRIRALVVRAPADSGRGLGPSTMLRLALQPYEDQSMPWPIRSKVVESEALSAADLGAADVAFLCEVPRFTSAQAKAIEDFTRNGGTTVLFLGPEVDAANYNQTLVQEIAAEGGLLPARLERPVGEIGPEAASVKIDRVQIDHPYFAGLYENHSDYLSVLVQRYYTLAPSARPGRTLVELSNGRPLIQTKPFGSGHVVLCTTTSSPTWSNLPITGLFLPMVARISLSARRELWHDATYLADAEVAVRPNMSMFPQPAAGEKLYLNVTPPAAGQEVPPTANLELKKTAEGLAATFNQTAEPGLYRWKVTRSDGGDAPSGSFAVNPFGDESRLEPIPAAAFQRAMKAKGVARVYVGQTLAAANAAAAAESQGRNWWDIILAVTILIFVFEAIVANRRSHEEVVPVHLQATHG